MRCRAHDLWMGRLKGPCSCFNLCAYDGVSDPMEIEARTKKDPNAMFEYTAPKPPEDPADVAKRRAEEHFKSKYAKETPMSNDLVTEEQAKKYTTLTITVPDLEEVVDSDGFQTHATIGGGFALFGIVVWLGTIFPVVILGAFLLASVLAFLGGMYYLLWMVFTDFGDKPIRWWPKKIPKK